MYMNELLYVYITYKEICVIRNVLLVGMGKAIKVLEQNVPMGTSLVAQW